MATRGYATLDARGRNHFSEMGNKRWKQERAIASDPEVLEAKARLKEAKQNAKKRAGIG